MKILLEICVDVYVSLKYKEIKTFSRLCRSKLNKYLLNGYNNLLMKTMFC